MYKSLIDKSKNSENAEKWEKKFFSLLDEHEATEHSYRQNEQLLCKTIARLALASTGFNHSLDPYLKKIQNQLKNGLISETLKQQLEEFSNALLSFDKQDNLQSEQLKPDLLFRFLIRQFPHRQAAFSQLEHEFTKHKANTKDLLLALHEIVDEEQSVITEIAPANNEDKIIRELLSQFLSTVNLPPSYTAQIQQLKMQTADTKESACLLLEQTFSLLLTIKQQWQTEQLEMTDFLSHVSEELAELAQQASEASSLEQKQLQQENLSEQSFSSEIQLLKKYSTDAIELDELKSAVQQHLKHISLIFQQQQALAKTRQNTHFQVVQTLLEKIKHLENHTQTLKKKFNNQHDQNLYDSLTKLPNRLAFEKYLQTALAQIGERGTPLSLVLWDIDLLDKIIEAYGHKAGNKTLSLIAQLLEQYCRKVDFIARYNDSHFLMLLYDIDSQTAFNLCEKIRNNIVNSGFNYSGEKITITLSCGIAEFAPDDTGTTILNKVITGLSKAKRQGRNQCVLT